MIGLFIFAIIFATGIIFGDATSGGVFLTATAFLRTWYIVWAVVGGSLLTLIALGLTSVLGLGGAAAGHEHSSGNKLATLVVGLAGASTGGGLSLLLFGRFALRYALLIGGTTLMLQAGEPKLSLGDFDLVKLLLGVVLVAFGIILSRSSSRSKTSASASRRRS